MPQSYQDTKVHKEFILQDLFLVFLSAFVTWWQKFNIAETT
jgi:hypothetical protein